MLYVNQMKPVILDRNTLICVLGIMGWNVELTGAPVMFDWYGDAQKLFGLKVMYFNLHAIEHPCT